MKKKIWQRMGTAVLSVGMAISLVACGEQNPPSGKETPEKTGETVTLTAPLPSAVSNDVPPLIEEHAAELTDFGLRLAWHSGANGNNTLLSPVSVATALGITANGAAGKTLSEMETVLGMDRNTLNTVLCAYWRDLPECDQAVLRPANSIWFTNQERFSVEQQFLKTCMAYYDAELFQAPMQDQTCRDINRWVKEKTEGMIPEILDQIPKDAVMYLINALSFEGEWMEPYEKQQVQEGVFLTNTGMPVKTDFLYSEEGSYLENEAATGVMKLYQGGKYAFVGLLPKGDFTLMGLLDALDGESLQEMLRNPSDESVRTMLPKFETTYAADMREILTDMGMPQAFDSHRADFSKLGTSVDGNIYINRVLHQTVLSLGEQGTRAGAATVVEIKDEAMPLETEKPKEVFLDRPFLYLLIDTDTCVPFFLGTMNDPTGAVPVSVTGGAPMAVQIDGILYENTGKHGYMGGRCGTMDGRINSTVKAGEVPKKENQSNFGTGWEYQRIDDGIEMQFGRHWIVFEKAS